MPATRPDHEQDPHPSRLPSTHPRRDEILRRHAEAMAAGRVAYADPTTGFTVFTARFLAARGYCCGSGCRHCPYVGAGGEPGTRP
ncbi:MAG: DUF5522 domain-containing protein [Ilumatobacteraceae bacterium]|nr:DUF5522 domain-containing protein [Ilumatobacteraceae bacterium]